MAKQKDKKKVSEKQIRVPALKVSQWLSEWEAVDFNAKKHRRKPDPHFYLFTLSAVKLKALSGIQRRDTSRRREGLKDLGIQRRHDEERSKEICQFIRYGFPWSNLSPQKRISGEFEDLRKPGWLPTAIVINILKSNDIRLGATVDPKDLIMTEENDSGTSMIKLPVSFTEKDWQPKKLHPIEVIDGQHRLWALEDSGIDKNFEFPVVAFHGLDISWQAYLFWSINIKPKRINASLAYDLYPLLRTEDWLDKFAGHPIYRETRAQELTEALWAIPESPWHQRINMLGEPGFKNMVSQAAWIRSLMATFIRSWEGGRKKIGGLFGAPLGSHKEVLPWSRAQQAAYLIVLGNALKKAIKNNTNQWAVSLRTTQQELFESGEDLAFTSSYSLLNTDQGIRGFLHVANDLCYINADNLKLKDWMSNGGEGATDQEAVGAAIKSLTLKRNKNIVNFVENIATSLAKFDWRTSSMPTLTDEQRTIKAAFRGSGGYKELRIQLLTHVSKEKNVVGKTAIDVQRNLGFI